MIRDRRPEGRRRGRGGRALPQGRQQGPPQGHVQDGHLDAAELPRRADLRGDRPQPRARSTATSPGRASRIEGVGLDVDRRARARRATTTRTRSSPALDGELDVGGQYQWRRRGEFHMYNPEIDRQAAARGARRQLHAVQGVHARSSNDESRELCDAARPAAVQAGEADPDRRGRAGERDRQALQDRRDVARLDQPRGAREPRDRHEPHRRQVEHRRGRRGSGALQAATRTATRAAARSSRWPPAASASPATTWSTPTSCRSRWRRAPSPARAASCPATRSTSTSPRSATRRRASA